MSTYLRPGAFVEETLLPLAASNSASSEAVAAFVGTSAKGGPLGPTLVTSWAQYRALFGDIQSNGDDLGYAIFTFFNNGGSAAYVVRAVKAGSTAASTTLVDGNADPALVVHAKAPGLWASDPDAGVFVTVAAGSDGRFDLTVETGTGKYLSARQTFVDLSLDPSDPRNALQVVNSSTVGSRYVTLDVPTGVFGVDYLNPVDVSRAALTGGSDGTGTPDMFAAVQTLEGLEGNFVLNLPGVGDAAVLSDVVTWAEGNGNFFVVVDAPKPGPADLPANVAAAATTLASALPTSSHAAVYGPWLYIADPASRVSGALRVTAPGGSVVGQYVHNDVTRGIQKVPAGTSTSLRGVIDVSTRFSNAALDALNQTGVNVIRAVPGAGFCIMGGRTLNPGMPDRYINIRRSLMLLERDLINLTRTALFDVNDAETWGRLSAICSQYLNTQFQKGVLSGSQPNQAFYVICDDTINTASSVNSGVVNIEVGVALNSPAEFIVIRIGQFDGGSTVTES